MQEDIFWRMHLKIILKISNIFVQLKIWISKWITADSSVSLQQIDFRKLPLLLSLQAPMKLIIAYFVNNIWRKLVNLGKEKYFSNWKISNWNNLLTSYKEKGRRSFSKKYWLMMNTQRDKKVSRFQIRKIFKLNFLKLRQCFNFYWLQNHHQI